MEQIKEMITLNQQYVLIIFVIAAVFLLVVKITKKLLHAVLSVLLVAVIIYLRYRGII